MASRLEALFIHGSSSFGISTHLAERCLGSFAMRSNRLRQPEWLARGPALLQAMRQTLA